jgi:branched-chain amino acid transport system permease protein
VTAWIVAACFLGAAGALYGNLVRFIDPTETAFAGATIGVWMILMALLGGSGTLLGPVIGAVVFQVFKELFWTYLLGWQRVALGLLIVLVAVFFPQGIMGFVRDRFGREGGTRSQSDAAPGEPGS